MANGKKATSNAVRRAVCSAAGGRIGSTVSVKCATCDHVGEIEWDDHYAYWPMVSGLEFDHIIPTSRGGLDVPENVRLLCRRCNRSKGAKV